LEATAMTQLLWNVYLMGEIHSDWRRPIVEGIAEANLPVRVLEPVTDHDKSNASGVHILGDEEKPFWRDHKAAKLNAIRNRTFARQADVVVAFFGGSYRQWNTAFEAGYAVALGKPLIIVHDPEFNHALKEVDASAQAVAETPEQVVAVLEYVIAGILE
jgi:YtoQ family protein